MMNVELNKLEPSYNQTKIDMTPMILKKKIKDKASIIPLKTPNDLGHIRHFPAANREWSTSVYAYYNNNDIKSIPVLDKNLVKLIKSFLNFYHQSEKLKSKRIHIRFRRLSLKKIFVNKAELKHTNSKVVINIHVYNIQKRLLMKEIESINTSLLYPKQNKSLKPSIAKKLSLVKSAIYNHSPTIYVIVIELIEKERLLIINNNKKSFAAYSVKQQKQGKSLNKNDIPYFFYLMKERLYKAFSRNEIEKEKFIICNHNLDNRSINEWDFPSIVSLIEDIEKEKLIIKNIIRPFIIKKTTALFSQASRDLKKVCHQIPLFDSVIKEIRVKSKLNKVNSPLTFNEVRAIPSLYRNILVKCLDNELEVIRYYKFLFDLYDHKFKCLIPKLKQVISKIYKKKVEFNIVSLKHMYLNSDILSQAIVLKLKVRKNRLLKVLKSCLSMVKLPNTNRLKEISKGIIAKSLVNKIQKLDLDSLTSFVKLPHTLWGAPILRKGPFFADPLHLANCSIASLEVSPPSDPLKKKACESLEGQDNDSLNLLLFGIMSLRPCFVDNKNFVRLENSIDSGRLIDINNYDSVLDTPDYEGAADIDSFMLKPSIVLRTRGMPQLPTISAINNFFLKCCLKHKSIGGVRLEAKGRLTKRFTASRSVFKLKWKGSLKNIDSSYKGFSAVILRGHMKSNVQYSVLNSYNRIGSYGIKTWVSGK